MSRRFRMSAFAAALAVLAAVAWWTRPSPVPPDADPVARAIAVAEPDPLTIEGSLPPPPPAPASAAPPLPPADAPLAQVLPGLAARADAGDRRAACRLGLELLRCQHLGAWHALMDSTPDNEAALVEKGDLAAANSIAEEKLWRLERLQQCRAVPTELQDAGARYLRQAALAGDPSAMLSYAEGHHWSTSMRGAALGPEFDQWRREAPGLVHAALRAGNPTAAYILQLNYRDDFGFLSALIPNDDYRSYTYHLLVTRLFGHREIPAFAGGLDAAQMERAREEAAAMHARYFDNRRFPSHLALLYPPYVRHYAEPAPAFCEFE